MRLSPVRSQSLKRPSSPGPPSPWAGSYELAIDTRTKLPVSSRPGQPVCDPFATLFTEGSPSVPRIEIGMADCIGGGST